MEQTSGIHVTNLNKSFGKMKVLVNSEIHANAGEIIGIVGNNGSGKTVLMKCICGFLKPDSGIIIVNGKQVGKDCDFPPDLGIIIETPGFIPTMSGQKNLRSLAALRGKIGKREVTDVLKKVGLYEARHKAVAHYSLGMRQRLGIAQAIMENPSVLILDEPFNGLDAATVSDMRTLLLSLKSQNKAIILASHNAEDIRILCDRIYEMKVNS